MFPNIKASQCGPNIFNQFGALQIPKKGPYFWNLGFQKQRFYSRHKRISGLLHTLAHMQV